MAKRLGRKQKREELQKHLEELQKAMVGGGAAKKEKAADKAVEEKQRLLAIEEELKKASLLVEQERKEAARLEAEKAKTEEAKANLEEGYGSLKEEAAGQSRKLKKMMKKYKSKKDEIKDVQSEWEREKESYLENHRSINKELKLYLDIIAAFLAFHEIDRLQKRSRYDEDSDQWILPNIEIPVFSPKIGAYQAPATVDKDKEKKRKEQLQKTSYLDVSQSMSDAQRKQLHKDMSATLAKDSNLVLNVPDAFNVPRQRLK